MTDPKIRLTLAAGDRSYLAVMPEDASLSDVAQAFCGLLGTLFENQVGAVIAMREAAGVIGPELKEEDGAWLPRGDGGGAECVGELCECGWHVKQSDGLCLSPKEG